MEKGWSKTARFDHRKCEMIRRDQPESVAVRATKVAPLQMAALVEMPILISAHFAGGADTAAGITAFARPQVDPLVTGGSANQYAIGGHIFLTSGCVQY